jgi:hypothetical protein
MSKFVLILWSIFPRKISEYKYMATGETSFQFLWFGKLIDIDIR